MMASDSILKKGYLYQFRNKQEAYGWERLYFVLHGHSAKNEARLDWYDSLESSLSNPGLRSGIFLEEITRVERIAYQSKMEPMYGPSANFLFGIFTCRIDEPYVVKCVDAETLNDWVKQLSRLLREVRQLKRASRKKAKIAENIYSMHNTPECLTFAREVDVEATSSAQRQGISGRYRLVLSRQHLSLTNPADSSTALFWHYSHVRRFGYSDRTFTIEGGQRSGPGEGLFILKNCEGHALFNEVQEKIRLLRQSRNEGQAAPTSPVVAGAWSKEGAILGATPTGSEENDEDTSRTLMLQDRPDATPCPASDNPLSPAVFLNRTHNREPGFEADGDEAITENAHQQSNDEDDDDDDSRDEDQTDEHSIPEVPPKNFDLGSLLLPVDLQSIGCSSGKENLEIGAKGKDRQGKKGKASRVSSIIQFGPFKRFTSPPPHATKPPPSSSAAARSKEDKTSEMLSLVDCLDEGNDLKDEVGQVNGSPPIKPTPVRTDDVSPKSIAGRPRISEKKPFWRSSRARERTAANVEDELSEEGTMDEQPPPVKPKNFRREVTASNDDKRTLVAPSLPSRTKPSPKDKCNPKGKKTPLKVSEKIPAREAPVAPNRTAPKTPTHPGRYVGSDARALQKKAVEEASADGQTVASLGPKMSEVLLHMESCQVSASAGGSSRNADDGAVIELEDEYNRIDLRAEAAGRARPTRGDTDDELHLYGQPLISHMMQQRIIRDEPEYEDIVLEPKPKKKGTKK